MDCTKTYLRISEYIDGCLDEGEAERIRAHIECCSECRSVYDDHMTIQADLQEEMTEVDLPDGIWNGLQARIAHEKAVTEAPRLSFWQKLNQLFGGRRHWYAVPGLAVVLLGLVTFSGPWMLAFKGGQRVSPEIFQDVETDMQTIEVQTWDSILDAALARERAAVRRFNLEVLDDAVDKVQADAYSELLDRLSDSADYIEG